MAKLFDLRTFIGVLFVIFGVLVTISGLIPPATIDKAAGINLALWVGGFMLALGLIFLLWLLLSPPPPSRPRRRRPPARPVRSSGLRGRPRTERAGQASRLGRARRGHQVHDRGADGPVDHRQDFFLSPSGLVVPPGEQCAPGPA